ncbi:MAG: histidine phosphatase family protein [Candidatus Yanofskybacteria bacterium]|nr:histidine phosphatase family protein [Candidatus Yanofskybacteria bacterium]
MKKINFPKLLVLVRHAESARNTKKKGVFFKDQAEKIVAGELSDENISLTERGIEQARQTGVALRKAYGLFDVVFHSGYVRAEETVKYILEGYGRDRVKIESRAHSDILLRERAGGYTRNMLAEEVRKHFPWRKNYWDNSHPMFAVPPGGESVADVCTRINVFLVKLRLDYPDKKVLVVSHARTTDAFRMVNEELSFEKTGLISKTDPANCGVTEYKYKPDLGKLILCSYDVTYWK